MEEKQEKLVKKLQGAYYTPVALADSIVNLFQKDTSIQSILEPSCGEGVFLESWNRLIGFQKKEKCFLSEFTAIDRNRNVIHALKRQWNKKENVHIICKDFFDYYMKNVDKKKYDLILGNPPYIRYQLLEKKQREEMSNILMQNGMESNKLSNAWVGFLVACVRLLKENGKIAFIIPAELLQIGYAKELRLFLAKQFSRITLITFKKLIFSEIEQEVIVFYGEKGEGEARIRVVEFEDLSQWQTGCFEEKAFQVLQNAEEKWTKYFVTAEENKWIERIKQDSRFCEFSEVAFIHVGITTGNNSYFLVNQKVVKQYHLTEITRPIVGRNSHVKGVYFGLEDWTQNVKEGKNVYFIQFPEVAYQLYPKNYKRYIREGEKRGEQKGYKCSIRNRWYIVPPAWIPDAFFLRRSGLYPRLVLNQCEAVSTDTMNRIRFYEGVKKEYALLSYYNSISFAFVELCGRSYGGGMLEILPKEMEHILLPKLEGMEEETVSELLSKIDNMIKKREDIERVLDLVDEHVLIEFLHIDSKICKLFRKIWLKLKQRRLGRS